MMTLMIQWKLFFVMADFINMLRNYPSIEIMKKSDSVGEFFNEFVRFKFKHRKVRE
jgi:hypothetical protein